MASARVHIHDEVRDGSAGGWQLCFQRVTFTYDDGSPDQDGYRFIWRRPNETLQAARGQARIPDAATHDRLIKAAKSEGWFH